MTGTRIAARQAKAKLIPATKNDQTSLLDLRRPALDLAEFAVAGPEGYDKQLFILVRAIFIVPAKR